ncbi:MAG: hypothetical protein ETSY1_41910, partial [Candidatus Entotheonella factor]
MTHTTLQAVLAWIAAALSISVAIGGLAVATRHAVHRIFALVMACLALMQLGAGLSAQSIYGEGLRLLASASLPGLGLLFSVCFARLHSREHVRAMRWAMLAAFVLPLGWILAQPRHVPLNWSGYGLELLILSCAVAVLAQLEKTLRASAGRVRAQIKFVLLGMGCVFAAQVYTASQTVLLGTRPASLIGIEAAATIVANMLMIAASIRRRSLDVKLYVARPFPFHAVSLKITLLYLLLLIAGLPPSGALWAGGLLVITTIVLLSDVVRYESRRLLNRYIFRSRYDYRRIWTLYTQRMAAIVDLQELCHVIAKLVSDTFGVPAVTVWLVHVPVETHNRLVIGGSTVCWDRQTLPSGWEATVQALMTAMRPHTMPIDLASPLRQRVQEGPREILQAMRIRYGTVLVSGHQILGMITLSDRLTREPFVAEDFDLLKTISDQVAASLHNAQVSQHLLEMRRMDTLQTVSTFFVHDLKNLAAKLSLMVQNLPVHYDNPAFRGDMLNVISKSVDKMNVMCSRLALFTHDIELHLAELDLNILIRETVSELEGTSTVHWHYELLPLPPIPVDREQIKKVIHNLLLNAIEAVDQNGEIYLSTAWIEPWVRITIRDNGCGMAHEFLNNKLFEPFQTTKSQGLGIGMFHSNSSCL